MEGFFDILGAGGAFPMGKKAHNVALGGSQIHFFQRPGDGLIGTPVQDPGLVSIMSFQSDHLLKLGSALNGSLLLNMIATGQGKVKRNLKSLQTDHSLL